MNYNLAAIRILIRYNSTLAMVVLPVIIYCQSLTGTVLSVQDGDSFRLYTPDSVYRIRLYGIDCPEINQPFGTHAKIVLDQLLNDTVTVQPRDTDKYGRTIADVFYKDSSLSYSLIKTGLAWHYKKYSNDDIYNEAEQYAQNNSIGLWRDENPIAPWDWRSGNFDRSLIQKDTSSKVFVCVGQEEMHYHLVHFCENLKACKSSIVVILPVEAMDVFRKTKCPKCLN